MSEDGGKVRIRITQDGPYQVSGGPRLVRVRRVLDSDKEPIAWEWSEECEAGEGFALCRCGQSGDKPLCDGTHAQVDFDGTPTADRRPGSERREEFKGSGIFMTDDRSLCAGYGFCHPYGGVWKQMEQTTDANVRARVERQVLMCPTGRLEYAARKGEKSVEEKYEPTIALIPDGALWVLGCIPIEADDGFVYETRNRVCLCRCGASANKPFCDGAHRKVGFEAP